MISLHVYAPFSRVYNAHFSTLYHKIANKSSAAGVPVLLCGGRPEGLEGEVIAASELPARMRELGLADITVEGDCPLLRHYHVRRNGADVFMFFNEDSIHTARTAVRLPVGGEFVRLQIHIIFGRETDFLCRFVI